VPQTIDGRIVDPFKLAELLQQKFGKGAYEVEVCSHSLVEGKVDDSGTWTETNRFKRCATIRSSYAPDLGWHWWVSQRPAIARTGSAKDESRRKSRSVPTNKQLYFFAVLFFFVLYIFVKVVGNPK
jgi:hypothetical protein